MQRENIRGLAFALTSLRAVIKEKSLAPKREGLQQVLVTDCNSKKPRSASIADVNKSETSSYNFLNPKSLFAIESCKNQKNSQSDTHFLGGKGDLDCDKALQLPNNKVNSMQTTRAQPLGSK